MNRGHFLALPALLFLASCATGYHSQGFLGGGYSEIITHPDSFIVSFKGNEYTTQGKALQYAMLRASELTLANGYKYFAILSSMDQSSSYNYSSTQTGASESASTFVSSKHANTNVKESGSSTTYSGVIVKPGTSIKIKCYMEKPQTEEVIDALFYWNSNKEK